MPKIAVVLVSVQILEIRDELEAINTATKNILDHSKNLHPIVIASEIVEAENLSEQEILDRLKGLF